jgi:hypothetical protein
MKKEPRKIYVTHDEQYPVFDLSDKPEYDATEIKVTDATLRRWQKVLAQYGRLQKRLRGLSNYDHGRR